MSYEIQIFFLIFSTTDKRKAKITPKELNRVKMHVFKTFYPLLQKRFKVQ